MAPFSAFDVLVDAASSAPALDNQGGDAKTDKIATDTTTITPRSSTTSVASGDDEDASSNSSTTSAEPKKTFAETLMTLLLDEDFNKVVTFLPDKQSFGIIHAKEFSEEVMPKIFGIRTFSSFVRKLHRWGFERTHERKTHDVDIFRHALFHKADWKMCARIKCVGRSNKKKTSADIAKQVLLRRAAAMPQQQHMPDAVMNHVTAQLALPPQHLCQQSNAIQDVTSQVVGAALQTLRRDEVVSTARGNLQQMMQRERARAQLMLMRHTAQNDAAAKLLARHISPRSSMVLF